MKFKLFSLSLLMFITSLAIGQFSPVSWTHEAEKINDYEYRLVFTAEIESGWFVYSQFLDDGGPIPTSFTFEENSNIEILGAITEVGDNKKENFDDLFGMKLIKYGDQVKFTQKIKTNSDKEVIKGYLTYMTCNSESCLPPKDIDFEIQLN